MLASALPSVSRLDRRSKEGHGVVEVVLPRVIAEDGEHHQCHLVHQMVNDGEPLHARGQADEMALGLLLE